MKTIQVSDDDYNNLMELSKQLQIQQNDCQAFPYFWSPRSSKVVLSREGCEDFNIFYKDGEAFDLDCIFESEDKVREEFLKYNHLDEDTSFDDIKRGELVLDFEDFIVDFDYEKIPQKYEKIEEQNFSLFKQDVKDFIEGNKHHLGGNPHTYANTILRMSRMEQLVKILYRLNPQPENETNEEALIYRNR